MAGQSESRADVLTAPYSLQYSFTRSTGKVIGRFLAALREKRILGVRMAGGGVMVPPQEYDPLSSDALDELVEVGQSGEVVTWSWVQEPLPEHPLDRPFAWALVRLDGADTSMLHAVEVDHEGLMRSGMRVTVSWRDEPKGFITDIRCFVEESGDV